MDHDTDVPVGATDRRTALKKAAVAAGVVAWTTPVVQVLSAGTAHAQTVTGCSPMITVTMLQTGKECGCVPVDPNCCNSFTYFPTATATCGSLCGGTVTPGVVTLTPLPPTKCPPSGTFPGTFVIGCPPALITISAMVTCPDGTTTKVTAAPGDIVCKFCVEPTPQFVPQSDVSEMNEATATTTTQPVSEAAPPVSDAPPPPTEAAPPPPTEPAAAPAEGSTP